MRRLRHEFDVLHVDLYAPRGRVPLIAYAAWPTRVLFVDHVSGTASPSPSGARSRLADRVTAVRWAGLAGVSEYVRTRDVQRFGIRPPRARTIYNGVDVARFVAPSRAPLTHGVGVLAAANLIPEKGLDTLVDALGLLPAGTVQLSVAGDGPALAALRERAAAVGRSADVTFLGLRDDLPALLGAAAIFVHPARWAEAFGLTVAEAMAAGCAVVASRVGAIPELIVDGESGILVPPGDAAALARALASLAAAPDTRARLGAAARQRAVERFDLAACVRAHLEWCESVSAA
jgi:glycosyltransferase involved in cell wall biosynthesis